MHHRFAPRWQLGSGAAATPNQSIHFILDIEDVVDFPAHDVDDGGKCWIAVEQDRSAIVDFTERQEGLDGPQRVAVDGPAQRWQISRSVRDHHLEMAVPGDGVKDLIGIGGAGLRVFEPMGMRRVAHMADILGLND